MVTVRTPVLAGAVVDQNYGKTKIKLKFQLKKVKLTNMNNRNIKLTSKVFR